jgi:hypothetical protein
MIKLTPILNEVKIANPNKIFIINRLFSWNEGYWDVDFNIKNMRYEGSEGPREIHIEIEQNFLYKRRFNHLYKIIKQFNIPYDIDTLSGGRLLFKFHLKDIKPYIKYEDN